MIQLPPVFTNEQWQGESVIQSSHLITRINNKWADVQEAREDLLSCSRYLSARLTSLLPRAIEGCDRRLANDVPQKPQNKFLPPKAGRKGITESRVQCVDCKKARPKSGLCRNFEWIPQPTAFRCLNFPPTDGWTSWLSAERSLCFSSSCLPVCVCVRAPPSLQPKHLVYALMLAPGRRSVDRKEKKKKGKQSVTLPRHEKWIWPQKFWGLDGSSKRAGTFGGGGGQEEEQWGARKDGRLGKKKSKMHRSETFGYWKL